MWFTRFIEKQEPLLGERKLRGEAEKVDSEPDSQAGVCVWGGRQEEHGVCLSNLLLSVF